MTGRWYNVIVKVENGKLEATHIESRDKKYEPIPLRDFQVLAYWASAELSEHVRVEQDSTIELHVADITPDQPKRKRGRPRKNAAGG